MNKSIQNKQKVEIVSTAAFIISFILCAVFGWFDVINYLFSSNGENVGKLFEMPLTYTIVCFLFVAVLCAIVILGYVFKSKLLVIIALSYELLFILAFVLLGVFSTGNITSQGLYDLVSYLLAFALIPVYSVIWNLNLLFFIIFIPLTIYTVYAFVRVFKKSK